MKPSIDASTGTVPAFPESEGARRNKFVREVYDDASRAGKNVYAALHENGVTRHEVDCYLGFGIGQFFSGYLSKAGVK